MTPNVIRPRHWAYPSEPEDQDTVPIPRRHVRWWGVALFAGAGMWWVFTIIGLVVVIKAVVGVL